MATLTGGFDAGVASFQSEEFYQNELFTGNTPLAVTDGPETVPENTEWAAFTVVGLNADGKLALATFAGGFEDEGAVQATSVLTFATPPDAGDTVTIGDVVYTWAAAPALTEDPLAVEVLLHATDVDIAAANLAAAINDSGVEGTTYSAGAEPHPDVYATVEPGSNTLTVRANVAGTAGNGIATTQTGDEATWGAAETANGAAGGTGVQALGITTAPVTTGAGAETTMDIFRAGCFNPDALTWDASFNTAAKKRTAFQGSPSPTNIVIRPIKYGAVFP